MAVSSGFFNSQNHDRRYDAEQMSQIFDGIIEDGVYQNVGTAFNVTAGPGNMQVTVGTGRAWLMNTWTLNDSNLVLDINAASLSSTRVDCIAIEVDKRKSVRENKIVYIFGSGPDKPSLIEDTDHRQYPLAYVTVGTGITQIYQKDIEYIPGTDPLPFVRSPLETLNISNVLQQFDSEFNLWFDTVKDIIDESEVGDLANQLVEINHRIDANAEQIDRLVKEVFDPSQGQNLGTYLTAAQKAAIENGSFSGLYPGDYWEINGTKWYIIDYDYYMKFTPNDGTPACTKHHLVVMPDKLFAVDGIIDVTYPLPDYKSAENREEQPYILYYTQKFSHNTFGQVGKAYIANKPLTTTTGFDWISPSEEAINLAVSAFGEDNLVAVPDVNGQMSTFMQDFEWKTYSNGVLIPHFFDCQTLYGSKGSSFAYGTFLNGINNGNLNGSVPQWLQYKPSKNAGTGFQVQHGGLFPENGQKVRFYLDASSPNRSYLSSRFVSNVGFATKITDIPNLANALKNSISNPVNESDIKVYLRDAFDEISLTFDMIGHGAKNELPTARYDGPDGYITNFSDFDKDVSAKLLSIGYTADDIFDIFHHYNYDLPSNITFVDEYGNRMKTMTDCFGYGVLALVPMVGTSYFNPAVSVPPAQIENMSYRFGYVNSSGEKIPSQYDSKYDGSAGSHRATVAEYYINPTGFKIFSSFGNTYATSSENYAECNRNLPDYYYPIVCCVG